MTRVGHVFGYVACFSEEREESTESMVGKGDTARAQHYQRYNPCSERLIWGHACQMGIKYLSLFQWQTEVSPSDALSNIHPSTNVTKLGIQEHPEMIITICGTLVSANDSTGKVLYRYLLDQNILSCAMSMQVPSNLSYDYPGPQNWFFNNFQDERH